jgi:hypothetical protein
VVPRSIHALKTKTDDAVAQQEAAKSSQATRESRDAEYEQVFGMFFRYAEYCVTAPLLFLAVVCLLVPDAPAW